uniref:Oocyte zinc finger protein XlCOF7.1-like n=1 Tax=Paramormyrops kingsleyae TaxID=1676925 RepID=A0A3B3T1T1_9TELE|nr:oocyte zinc finger protein XlCOF7.1-like isoform X1 [Paramormyrops kingsleyae]
MLYATPSPAAIRAQLASVMEALASAAVADIYKVVEESCVTLRLEITRSQKENAVLRSKMQTLELHIAQLTAQRAVEADGGAGAPRMHGSNKDCFSNEAQVTHSSLQTDGRLDGEDASVPPDTIQDECPKEVRESPTQINIKEERTEEDFGSIHSQGLVISGQRHEELISNCEQGSVGKRDVISEGDMEDPREQQPMHSDWELGALEGGSKKNNDGIKHRFQQPRANDGVERCSTLDCIQDRVYMLDNTHSQPGHLHSPEDNGAQAESSCSFTSEGDSKTFSGATEPQAAYGSAGFSDPTLSFLGPIDWNSAITSIDPGHVKIDFQIHSLWNEETVIGRVHPQQCNAERQDASVENVTGMCTPQAQIAVSEKTAELQSKPSCMKKNVTPKTGKTDFRVGRKEKRFSCTYYENNFSQSKDLETYQSPHTTEKPFSCVQCGKRFLHIRDLKGHQRVHTGEKPFSCSQCEKRFSYLHQLKTHQRVHTGEKPFSCAQCGKRFSQSSHIKRHQSVHTGEKRFSCTLCGKRFSQSCSLKVHQIVHTGERPFSCTRCGKTFSILGNLIRHQNVHIGK